MASGSKIGALMVSLGLDSANFQTGLKKSQSTLATFGKSMAAGALTAVAGFVSITAAVNGARTALEHFGRVNDAALASGLDSEAFQALAYQASLAGVNFEQLTGALGTFNKNAGLAAEGKGKMYSALKALNPELLANIQSARTQEERVRLAADAIDRAASSSEKAALSTALFGDAGLKMAAIFDGGAASIDRAAAKARDLGIIMDRELIARADEMGDQFDAATQVVDLQFKQALIELAPFLVSVAKLAGDVASSITGVIDSMNALDDRSRRTLEQQRAALIAQQKRGPAPGYRGGAPGAAGDSTQAQIDAIDKELRERAVNELRTKLSALPRRTTNTETTDDLAAVPPAIRDVTATLQPLSLGLDDVSSSALKASNTIADDLGSAFADIFGTVIRGGDALDAVSSKLADFGSQFLDMGMKGLFNALLGGIGGGFGGGFSLGNFNIGGMSSYEGGGYTGMGSRSGGVDGRGGFPALLHPNETVIDHTKGGGGDYITVSVVNEVRNGNLVPVMTQVAGQVAGRAVQQQAPSVVAKARRDKVS